MLKGVHSIEICSLHLWRVLKFWNETWYFLLPLCKGRAVRTLLTQQPAPGLWHFWLHVEVLIQQRLSPAADTVSKQCYWHHCKRCLALAEQFAPNPSISDGWMHKLSYSQRCPGFPHVSPKSRQSRYSFEQNTCPCFILLLFLFRLWKLCHFCGWLNHLKGFWGFHQEEDVHWGLFTKLTERSCSDTQYLGLLHRKPHSLLPSHKGQPHSWSFTCVFIYLKGNYHLGFSLMLVISDFYSKRIHTHTHVYIHFLLGSLTCSVGLNAPLRGTNRLPFPAGTRGNC